MIYALIANRPFTRAALGFILAGAMAASPAAGQTRTARTSWDFRTELVEGRPVLKVVRMASGTETAVREIKPEDVPFKETDCGRDCRGGQFADCFGLCLVGGLHLLLFDEAHDTAYIEGSTDSGQNAHRVLFKLDVRSGQLVRIGDTFASDLQQIQVSPDGRYLSYLAASSDGADDGAWLLNVLHLDTGVEISATARLSKQGRELGVVVNVSNYKWRDASTLIFTTETRPHSASAGKTIPRGMATRYVYAAAEDRLTPFTASESRRARER